MRHIIAASIALVLLTPALASAQERGPLRNQPAVRHKMELRRLRFEVAPTFDMSVAADYKSTYSAGLKGEFHFSDMWSVGGQIFAGTSSNTGLANQVSDSLPDNMTDSDPTPSQGTFENSLNKTPLHGGAHITFTPLFGKISLFGKTYLNFDIYFKGGLAFASLTSDYGGDGACGPTAEGILMDPEGNPILDANGMPQPRFVDPRNDCPDNTGTRLGLMLGGGMHFFLNKWVALDLSMTDYRYSDNPRGGDFDGDGRVDGDDRRFMGHLFFGVGISLYLPTSVKRSP